MAPAPTPAPVPAPVPAPAPVLARVAARAAAVLAAAAPSRWTGASPSGADRLSSVDHSTSRPRPAEHRPPRFLPPTNSVSNTTSTQPVSACSAMTVPPRPMGTCSHAHTHSSFPWGVVVAARGVQCEKRKRTMRWDKLTTRSPSLGMDDPPPAPARAPYGVAKPSTSRRNTLRGCTWSTDTVTGGVAACICSRRVDAASSATTARGEMYCDEMGTRGFLAVGSCRGRQRRRYA